MQTGDIYLVHLPFPSTHEQGGTRPAVIAVDFPELPVAQVIPLTTSENAKKFKNTLVIKPDTENHLEKTSVAMLFQLRAIDKRRLKNKIGALGKKDKEALMQSLKKMFGF